MNVVILAPHPDDEAIGCGGSIACHVQDGDRVSVVFMTSGELALKNLPAEEAWRIREGEARSAGDILGVDRCVFLRLPDWTLGEAENGTAVLGTALERLRPELVYAPHAREWHPDHEATARLARDVIDHDVDVRTYEVWTPLSRHEHVRDISSAMERKLAAIDAYESQSMTYDYRRAALGLGQYRGALAGRCEYAEVFGVL